MKRIPCIAIIVALGAVLAAPAWPLENSVFAGTWVFNLAKSKVDPALASVSYIVAVKSLGGGKWESTTDTSIGGKLENHSEIIFAFDNHAYAPVSAAGQASNATGLTESFQYVNANTIKLVLRVKGKVVDTMTNSVSADGKTLTVSHSAAGPDGHQRLEVFDRK